MEKVTSLEQDRLKEVVNIGVGNASTALSQLVSREVKITAPDIFIDNIQGVPAFLGKTDDLITVIMSDLMQDIHGTMFLMLPPQSAQKLVVLLTGEEKVDILTQGEIGESALKEVGNILTGTCMTALSKFLDINVIASVPHIATDMVGAVIDAIVAKMVETSNTILVFRVKFSVVNEDIEGHFYLLFDPTVTETILTAMRKKFGN